MSGPPRGENGHGGAATAPSLPGILAYALGAAVLVVWTVAGLPGGSSAPPQERIGVSRPDLVRIGVNGHGFDEYRSTRDGSVLVLIPGGTFRVGWKRRLPGEVPEKRVTLSPYLIGKCEVTQAQMRVFCEQTGRTLPPRAWWEPRADEPAQDMFFDDATAYCDWAGLRLPTEMEWEFAARGDGDIAFPWGNEAAAARRARLSGGGSTSLGRTAPVGSFGEGASPFGCLDMLGNVWEWVSDWYAHPLGLAAESVDPQGPAEGEARMIRGGAWSTSAESGPMEERRQTSPSAHQCDIGFRVAASLALSTPSTKAAVARASKEPVASASPDEKPAHGPSVRRSGLAYRGVNSKGCEEYLNERDGSTLVYVPGGSFEIGRGGRPSAEEMTRRVVLSPYLIGKTEVTWAQMKRFCKATGRNPPPKQWWNAREDEPCVEMFWFDAAAYCEWAGLRLPTEMEWELAARGTDDREFPWGDEPEYDGVTHRAQVYHEGELGEFPRTCPVGRYPLGASPYGCLDMLGNAAEWCADWYEPELAAGPVLKDPRGAAEGTQRVVRGGGWNESMEEWLAQERASAPPGEQQSDIGFRVAVSP